VVSNRIERRFGQRRKRPSQHIANRTIKAMVMVTLESKYDPRKPAITTQYKTYSTFNLSRAEGRAVEPPFSNLG